MPSQVFCPDTLVKFNSVVEQYCQRVGDQDTANPTVPALQLIPMDDESGPRSQHFYS